MNDLIKLKGTFTAVKRNIKTNEVEVTRKDNIILNVGFDFIANAMCASSNRPAVMGYTAVGTSSTSPAATQTALINELGRKPATYAHTTGTKVFNLTTNFAAGEVTGAITEAGICNASSGGIFLDRVTFAVINKGADDELSTNFQFTMS